MEQNDICHLHKSPSDHKNIGMRDDILSCAWSVAYIGQHVTITIWLMTCPNKA